MTPEQRAAAVAAIEIVEELERRAKRLRCTYDLKYLTRVLYPPEDPANKPFWDRFAWPQEFLLDLCLAHKMRAQITVPAGFTVRRGGKDVRLEEPLDVDLSRYQTLLILQSRDTLKTAIRRVDVIHDMLFWPDVMGVPCASVWYGHREDMTKEQNKTIRRVAMSTDFARIAPDVVPSHRDWEKWGTLGRVDAINRPPGAPEPTLAFLGVDQVYTGGRYRGGHFDDVETWRDRDSLPERLATIEGVRDRENERDSVVGIKTAQGTPYHPDGVWSWLQDRRGVFTVKMPALVGDIEAFWEFAKLDDRDRVLYAEAYAEKCKPVFPHLGLLQLARKYDTLDRASMASQYFMDPKKAGRTAFRPEEWLYVDADQVPTGLPVQIFCDFAFKKPDNKFEGDNTAMVAVAYDKFGRKLIVDGVYSNGMQEHEVWDALASLIFRWRPLRVLTEISRQRDLNESWRTYALRNRVPIAYIAPLQKCGANNKHQDILLLDSDFRRGEIVFVRDHPFTLAVAKEAETYDMVSGCAKWDDGLDVIRQTKDPAARALFLEDFGADNAGEGGEDDDQASADWYSDLPGNDR